MRVGKFEVVKSWEADAFPIENTDLDVMKEVMPDNYWLAKESREQGDFIYLMEKVDKEPDDLTDHMDETMEL